MLMDYLIASIPLFFGMGLVAAGLLATYCVYRYMARAKSKSEDADKQQLLSVSQFVAIATIWMLVFTALFHGVDIVGSLVPQVAIYGRIQGPSQPRKEKPRPPKSAEQPSKAE